jgi:carbon monoxide dehydrogenase subunit G
MEFEASHVFDAPVDAVWAMFRDPRSHIAKFDSMGHRHIEVIDSHAGDDAFSITVRRDVDVDLPGFARRVLKPTNTVTSTDEWQRTDDGTCTGRQTVQTEGAPVKISSTTALTPEGDRTRYDVTVQLDVKVPLIGGKLADWSKGKVREQLDQEFAAGDRWLAAGNG